MLLFETPNPVIPNEPPIGEELRSMISGDIFFINNDIQFTFINHLIPYPSKTCHFCEVFFDGSFRLVTVNELIEYNDWLKANDQFLFPMLVWATKKGIPTLVKVSPGLPKPVKVVHTLSRKCLAYTICVSGSLNK